MDDQDSRHYTGIKLVSTKWKGITYKFLVGNEFENYLELCNFDTAICCQRQVCQP